MLLDSAEQDRVIESLHARNERDSKSIRLVLAAALVASAAFFARLGFSELAPKAQAGAYAKAAHVCSVASLLGALYFLWYRLRAGHARAGRARAVVALSLGLSLVPLAVWATALHANGALISTRALLPIGPSLLVGLSWHLEAEHDRCARQICELRQARYRYKAI